MYKEPAALVAKIIAVTLLGWGLIAFNASIDPIWAQPPSGEAVSGSGSVIVIGYDPSKAGTYILQVVVGTDGKYVVSQVKPKYHLTDPIDDDDDDDDDDGGDTDRVKIFKDASDSVNEPEMAKNLRALYIGMAQKARPPTPLYTTPAQLEKNLKQSTDIFLSLQSSKKKDWDEKFRTVLTDEWIKIAQDAGEMEDYAKLLDDAASGLGESSESEGEAFDIAVIFKILEIIGNPDLTRLQKILQILPLIITIFV